MIILWNRWTDRRAWTITIRNRQSGDRGRNLKITSKTNLILMSRSRLWKLQFSSFLLINGKYELTMDALGIEMSYCVTRIQCNLLVLDSSPRS